MNFLSSYLKAEDTRNRLFSPSHPDGLPDFRSLVQIPAVLFTPGVAELGTIAEEPGRGLSGQVCRQGPHDRFVHDPPPSDSYIKVRLFTPWHMQPGLK